MAGSREKPKQEARLIRVQSLRVGDKVRTAVKAKPVAVVSVVSKGEERVIEFSNSDVRTYHREDQVILVHREEDLNL